MGKPFFEVFPTLELNKSIYDIMEQTTVEKVSATKRKDFLRVYLFSTRLIKKDIIDTDGTSVSLNDSLFKLWLRRDRNQ
jgi:DNA polymerase-3 subunit alpha (Gram-positive type)